MAREREDRYSTLKLERMMPLMAYDEDILVSKTGDMTALFEIELPEIFSCGENDFDNLHAMWVRAMSSLPVDTIVHKQDFFIEKKFRMSRKDGRTFLSSSSDRHFDGRRFLDHHCYVYVTKCPVKDMRRKASSSPLNIRGFIPKEGTSMSEADFESSVASFASILRENGVETRRLDEKEVIGDETQFGLVERYMNLDFSKKGVLNDMVVLSDGVFKIGDKYVSMQAITDLDQLPQKVRTSARHNKFSTDNLTFAVGFPSSLCLALGFSHIYNQMFFIEDTKKNLKEIEISISRQRAFSAVSRENAVNMQFNEEFLDEVTRSGTRTVRCSFSVMMWDSMYPRLLDKNTLVKARLANLDITADHVLRLAPQMFWGAIPGGESYYPYEVTFLTGIEQACCFINNETNYHTSKSGFGIRLCDRISGVPVNVDISDEPMERHWIDNRNKFILGPSGSGKSFFTNHMVRQYWEQGTHVVIVDVGDSYLGLCRQIKEETNGRDGVYYTYKDDDPIRFNPFYVADGRYTAEKREQLNSLIFVLWKGDERITKAEETHVSTCVNTFINRWVIEQGRFPTFNLFYEYLCDEMRGYFKSEGVMRDNFDVENLIQVLRPYYRGGTYDYLLNATENLDLLNKRFIVFEIDNIKDHPTLFPVVTLVLMDTFISKMRHPSIASERKMILIEEAWKAISRQGTAEFIKYLYKTVRKHFGEAIVVTQEVDDIISNPIVKEAIISNADCKILLDQRKYQNKFEIVQTVLALSDKEKAIALSVNRDNHAGEGRSPYKEVFITLNGNHTAAYAVEVSREEYLTYTTEKREKTRLFELARMEGSMQKAIQRYIKEEKK